MSGCSLFALFFFKQKTAYEMRISDWSSDVCFSDLQPATDAARTSARRLRAFGAARRRQPCVVVTVEQDGGALQRMLASLDGDAETDADQIGRASFRERGGQYVWFSVDDYSFKITNRLKLYLLKHM